MQPLCLLFLSLLILWVSAYLPPRNFLITHNKEARALPDSITAVYLFPGQNFSQSEVILVIACFSCLCFVIPTSEFYEGRDPVHFIQCCIIPSSLLLVAWQGFNIYIYIYIYHLEDRRIQFVDLAVKEGSGPPPLPLGVWL